MKSKLKLQPDLQILQFMLYNIKSEVYLSRRVGCPAFVMHKSLCHCYTKSSQFQKELACFHMDSCERSSCPACEDGSLPGILALCRRKTGPSRKVSRPAAGEASQRADFTVLRQVVPSLRVEIAVQLSWEAISSGWTGQLPAGRVNRWVDGSISGWAGGSPAGMHNFFSGQYV